MYSFDDEKEKEEEEFQKLFRQKPTKKSKDSNIVSTKRIDNLSDVSSISSCNSNVKSLLTPPITRKRVPNDRSDVDDLIIVEKQFSYEEKTNQSETQNTNEDEEEMNRVYVQLERSSIALNYSIDESD